MTRKVSICTPVYGAPSSATVSLGYHTAATKLLRDPAVTWIDSRFVTNMDLVRARSRAVRMFLETDATDLLFWDEDVVPSDLRVIQAMLESGKDFVGVPYPRKEINWDHVADGVRDEDEQSELGRQTAEDLEGIGISWPLKSLDGKIVDNFARVEAIGMGFTLLSRKMLERMIVEYAPTLRFQDSVDGKRIPTVALFQLIISDGVLHSEDYSFCKRWRDIGGDCWVIADPAAHVGRYRFGSTIAG